MYRCRRGVLLAGDDANFSRAVVRLAEEECPHHPSHHRGNDLGIVEAWMQKCFTSTLQRELHDIFLHCGRTAIRASADLPGAH